MCDVHMAECRFHIYSLMGFHLVHAPRSQHTDQKWNIIHTLGSAVVVVALLWDHYPDF